MRRRAVWQKSHEAQFYQIARRRQDEISGDKKAAGEKKQESLKPGYFYPADVIEAFYWAWRASDYKIMPTNEDWLDQDVDWWRDVHLMHTIYERQEKKAKAQAIGPSIPMYKGANAEST